MLSIVIPTTRDITELRESLDTQTSRDFELLIQRERGLVYSRNCGWQRAIGSIVAFIDDDVVLNKNWVSEILKSFSSPEVGGVMGGVVTRKGNRDNDWTNPVLKKFFWKIGGIQACNMAFRRTLLKQVNGFDKAYSNGVGEWSEPDLVYRIKKLGFKVVHNEKAKLWHCPSEKGIYKERGEHSYWRMRNFMLFRKRWLKWDWNLIQIFIIFSFYWVYKFIKTGDKDWLGGVSALWRYE